MRLHLSTRYCAKACVQDTAVPAIQLIVMKKLKIINRRDSDSRKDKRIAKAFNRHNKYASVLPYDLNK